MKNNEQIIEELKDLIEFFQKQDKKVEEYRSIKNKDKLDYFEYETFKTMSEINFFFRRNFQYNLGWLEEDCLYLMEKPSTKIDIDTKNFYCGFIDYMKKKGISKTQSINLLAEITGNGVISREGFRKEVSSIYKEYSHIQEKLNKEYEASREEREAEDKEFNDLMDEFFPNSSNNDHKRKNMRKHDDIISLTTDLIRYSRNINIQNNTKNRYSEKKEKVFDKAINEYVNLWQEALDLFNKATNEAIEYHKSYKPKTKMPNFLNKEYANPLDFLNDIQNSYMVEVDMSISDKKEKIVPVYKAQDYSMFMHDIVVYLYR